MPEKLKAFLKDILVSLVLIFVMALFALLFGFIRHGFFTLAYVFNSLFLMGLIFLCTAIIFFVVPALVKPSILVDHSTIAERQAEKHREKQEKAFKFLFLGIRTILITGIIQLLLSIIIR